MKRHGAILLVEDNPDDILLIRTGFQRAGFNNPIIELHNGEAAIEYLEQTENESRGGVNSVPSLVLLDLKMPRVNGFETLTWIREHPEWRRLPIIVLTSSCFAKDINRAYELGANSFLTKPSDLQEYLQAIRNLAEFWLRDNSPPEPGPFIPPPISVPNTAPKPPRHEPTPDLTAPVPTLRIQEASREVGRSKAYSILLADDHDVVRNGLRALLEAHQDFHIVGEASSGREVVALAGTNHPDVVLMDIAMPELDGIEATRQVLSLHPGIRVIIFSTFSDGDLIASAIEAGAVGYLDKQTASRDIVTAVQEVTNGRMYFSPEVTKKLLKNPARAEGRSRNAAKPV